MEDNDQTRARREHLDGIRDIVGNVYPNKFERSRVTGQEDTVTAIVANEDFKQLVPAIEEGARPTPEQLEKANEELNKFAVRVSGRISTPPRVMGKAAFVHLSDGVQRLQIYVKKADVRAVNNDNGEVLEEEGKGWELFNLLDHGDFIGVEGYLFVTKTGELSIHVRELHFLAKALVPMPDKMHGISDPEIRQRQRYADLIAGSLKVEREEGELTPREVFELRSKVIREMRRFLDDHGYIEVETPMLTPLATGAAAKPFKTHHNALDIDLFARIAPELYLKRLLVGGFEKVYELNRNFRNEGIGYRWNPEFTMLEFYCAYMDANGMMDFCEELLRHAITKTTNSVIVRNDELELNFGKRFERLTMKEAIVRYLPSHLKKFIEEKEGEEFTSSWLDKAQNVLTLNTFLFWVNEPYPHLTRPDALRQVKKPEEMSYAWQKAEESLDAHTISIAKHFHGTTEEAEIGYLIQEIFELVAEADLQQPTFITDFPKPVSPLSKASPLNQAVAERFELYVRGMEIANGFSELNDPVEQRERFLEQMQQRERGDEEAMVLDEDYVRALSYGMPPAAGIGIGIDRLVMILANKHTIREVILFPHMRPERRGKEADEAQGEE